MYTAKMTKIKTIQSGHHIKGNVKRVRETDRETDLQKEKYCYNTL